MIVRAFAKINLTLRVLGRRPDGYHDLETVFQTIDLADEIRIEPAEGLSLTVEGDAPAGEDNLVLRAARALAAAAGGERGARLRLVKRIPAGGGLGGGSSDAAAVLLALDRLWCAGGLGPDGLHALAARLGADVPYFLLAGTALGLERGDRLTPMAELPERHVVLALPGIHLPTAAVFAAYAADPGPGGRPELEPGRDWAREGFRGFVNQLEPYAIAAHRPIGAIKAALAGAGAELALMTGSGSTVYGLFGSAAAAQAGATAVRALGVRAETGLTLDRAACQARRFASGPLGGSI